MERVLLIFLVEVLIGLVGAEIVIRIAELSREPFYIAVLVGVMFFFGTFTIWVDHPSR